MIQAEEKIRTNFHKNRVDLSINYNKKKKQKALFIQGVHKLIKDKLMENEEYK